MTDFDRDGLVSDLRILADRMHNSWPAIRQLADDVANGKYDITDDEPFEGLDLDETAPVHENDRGYDAPADEIDAGLVESQDPLGVELRAWRDKINGEDQ